MDIFLKIIVVVFVTIIMSLALSKNAKEFSVLLSLCVITCIVLSACYFLEPIVATIQEIATLGQIDDVLVSTLLKVTGIGVIAEFSTLLCNDSGNTALGKGVQILAAVVIIWLSLPLFSKLMDIVKNVLAVS